MNDTPLLPANSTSDVTSSDDADLQPPSPRKRGAPFGNHNRLLHGFYSASFTEKESQALDTDVKGEFHDEVSLLQVLINRTAQSVSTNSEVASDEYLNALRTITQAIARIESLRRSQRFLYSNQTTIEKAMEELAFLPPEED